MKNSVYVFFILMFASTLYGGTENQEDLLGQAKAVQGNMVDRNQPHRIPLRDDRILLDVFTEDFENNAEGWETLDLTNTDTAWHKSDFLNPEEDNLLWWCGDTLTDFVDDYVGYNNSWLQYLDTPVLDFADAADGLRLTFDAYWLIEDPRRVAPPDPYDGWDGFVVMISTDGGEEFTAINPESPAYHAERLSAAERWWDLGPTPGWTYMSGEWGDANEQNPEPEWVDVEFDLSDFASEEEVVVRFLLCSDRTVSAPFNPYLANSGIFIDNIVIEDGDDNVFLLNNADDDAEPAELIPRRGEGFGDWWELTDTNRPDGEGENCMWLEDDHYSLLNALQSPPIEIPEEMNVFYQYWVWCDLQDSDGDGNNQLEDFYEVYVSDDDGESWSRQHYDYNRDGVGGDGWAHYVPGSPFGDVNVDMDLSAWAGEEIMLRWVVRSDHNDDGGVGEGLFLDDIQVVGDDRMARDAGMENMVVPYPLTVGYRTPDVKVDIFNYGTRDLESIWAKWGWTDPNGGRDYPIIPRPDLAAEESLNLDLTDFVDRRVPGWTPTIPGEYPVWAMSTVGANTGADESDDDQAPENDRFEFESVRVNPANIFELGYDNRTYQFAFNFDAGTGPATRFSPDDAELGQYNIAAVKLQFNGLQNNADYRLHILEAGDDQTPGEVIISQDVEITPQESIPAWNTVLLYDQEELRNREGDFWVWVEILGDDGLPQIVGDLPRDDGSHFFNFDGQSAEPYDQDLIMHAVIVPEAIETPMLKESTDFLDFDVVRVGDVVTMQVRLYATAFAPVTISDISVDAEMYSLEFPEEVTLDFGEYYALDVVYSPTDTEVHEGGLTIETDAEEVPRIDLWGSGTLTAPEDGSELPHKFELSAAYPNPFNSMTRIKFSLERQSEAKISLHDIAGRYVTTLTADNYSAGSHSVAVNAESLSSGVYLIRLEANNKSAVQKIVLMK